jgi:hypothetical protein
MNSDTSIRPAVERRKPNRINRSKDYGWTMYMIIITVMMVIGFFISKIDLYKPGDNVGYNIGLVGGLMMLTLLFYPVRKRVRFMRNWGLLPTWFKWHMVFGILGPALIMFHSTFTIRSINAGVALVCMMLVSGSGIFGRFFYTKIHFGLYGRQVSFDQLHASLEGGKDVKSIFSFAPEIQQRLIGFRDGALKLGMGRKVLKPWDFMIISFRALRLSYALPRKLEDAMYSDALGKNWNDAQLKRLDELYFQNREFIENYIATLKEIAQFSTYERLFSLWHIFHVPLVYMLVFSAVWHVIAVHMY